MTKKLCTFLSMDINFQDLSFSPLLLYITIIILATWVLNLVIRSFFVQGKKKVPTKRIWIYSFFSCSKNPIYYALWALTSSFIIGIIDSQVAHTNWEDELQIVRRLILVLCTTWFLFEYKNTFTENWKQHRDKTIGTAITINSLSRLASVFLLVITVITVLQVLGVPLGAVVAAGGIGGAAAAFASQDVLKNLFSGIMLSINCPFNVGDWIKSPDKNIEGTVEHIGWYLTQIRSFEKRPIYVPNSLFSTIIVENPSRMTNRRIKASVGVRYQDLGKVPAITDDIRSMLANHEAIDQNLTTLVYFDNYGPSSLDILIYTFTKTRNWAQWLEEQQDVFLKIGEIIRSHGADIAFPTTTLDIPDPVDIHSNAMV